MQSNPALLAARIMSAGLVLVNVRQSMDSAGLFCWRGSFPSIPASPDGSCFRSGSCIPGQMKLVGTPDRPSVIAERLRSIDAEFGQSPHELAIEHLQFDPGQMRAKASVHAGAEGDMRLVGA